MPESDSDSESDDGSESGDDGRGELKVGDETAEIEFEDMDKPVAVAETVNEDDPLKEIEGKMGETLVLNM